MRVELLINYKAIIIDKKRLSNFIRDFSKYCILIWRIYMMAYMLISFNKDFTVFELSCTKTQVHSIRMNSRATQLKFVCPRMSYYACYCIISAVNCIFWSIETLNWLVAVSKLHKHRGTCCTAEWPYCPFAIL